MSDTKKNPTIYSLFLKYMTTNNEFKARHTCLTSRELMKKAIEEWKEIPDSKKKEWKDTYPHHAHYDLDTILKILFDDHKLGIESSNNIHAFFELQKETPVILSKQQMPN